MDNQFAKKYAPHFALLLIVLLGATLRFADLTTLPAGLQRDEALEALDALNIIAGARPFFLGSPDPREPLYAYLVAASISILGRTPAAIRLPATLASTATVLGIYLVGRSLLNRRLGLMAALISAFTVWPIVMGRFGVPPALLPLFLSFSLWLGIEAWKTGRGWLWMLSGLAMVGAFYTYSPVRIIVLALPLWAVVLLLTGRGRRLLRGAAYFSAPLTVLVAPMLLYNADAQVFVIPTLEINATDTVRENITRVLELAWDLYVDYRPRIAVVSPAGSDEAPRDIFTQAARQAVTVSRMFFVNDGGDLNHRHNIAGRPVFDVVMAIPFVIGMLRSFRRKRWLKMAFCWIWLVVGLLATILTDAPPHFNRAVTILPVLFIWPALGVDWIYHRLHKHLHPMLALIVASGLLVASAFITVRDYWLQRHFAQPIVAAYFHFPETDMPLAINRFLGVGWQGSGLAVRPRRPLPGRQVWVEPELWGTRQQAFLVPLTPGSDSALRFYDASGTPPATELERGLLFIVRPGVEALLAESLVPAYDITIKDPEWTRFGDFPDISPLYTSRLDVDQPPYRFVYAVSLP